MKRFKILILSLGVFIFTLSQTKASCKVYGISDSPQDLRCEFDKQSVFLKCQNGKYFLNGRPVLIAFHLETNQREDVVPLVFKAEGMTLTAVVTQKNDKKSELMIDNKNYFGNCSKI